MGYEWVEIWVMGILGEASIKPGKHGKSSPLKELIQLIINALFWG